MMSPNPCFNGEVADIDACFDKESEDDLRKPVGHWKVCRDPSNRAAGADARRKKLLRIELGGAAAIVST